MQLKRDVRKCGRLSVFLAVEKFIIDFVTKKARGTSHEVNITKYNQMKGRDSRIFLIVVIKSLYVCQTINVLQWKSRFGMLKYCEISCTVMLRNDVNNLTLSMGYAIIYDGSHKLVKWLSATRGCASGRSASDRLQGRGYKWKKPVVAGRLRSAELRVLK